VGAHVRQKFWKALQVDHGRAKSTAGPKVLSCGASSSRLHKPLLYVAFSDDAKHLSRCTNVQAAADRNKLHLQCWIKVNVHLLLLLFGFMLFNLARTRPESRVGS
jgi:hypothetical protein